MIFFYVVVSKTAVSSANKKNYAPLLINNCALFNLFAHLTAVFDKTTSKLHHSMLHVYYHAFSASIKQYL